jgi:subtilase family serine protease
MRQITYRALLSLLVTLLISSSTPFAVLAVPTQILQRHVPDAVKKLQPNGRLLQTHRLKLAIGLPLRNKDALDKFLADINDPASPNYHHYLTPEEFTRSYGPNADDYDAVATWAANHGLVVTTRHPNRVVVDVEGNVGDIEKALHVALRTYRHPTEARNFFAPDTDPAVDLATSIATIEGLQTYSMPHPNLSPNVNAANAEPNSGSAPGGSYGGCDFRSAYARASL